jgi:hypothetical protein
LITRLKNILSEFISNDDDFKVIYNDIFKVFTEFNIKISKVRKRKITFIVYPKEDTKHIIELKKKKKLSSFIIS